MTRSIASKAKLIKPSEALGSWPAIIAVSAVPYALVYFIGIPVENLTLHLSVLALAFTQLVLMQQNKENEEDKQVQEEQLKIEKQIKQEIKTNAR